MLKGKTTLLATTVLVSALLCGAIPASASEFSGQKPNVGARKKAYSPYVGQKFPRNVYFGDTHLHTSFSPDAGLLGNTLGPEDAYRFARGEEVIASGGKPVKLVRPLDFLVVSDHAEYMGLAPMIRDSNPQFLATKYGKRWHDMFRAGAKQAEQAFLEIVKSATKRQELIKNPTLKRSIWQGFTKIADRYNQAGTFTAFIGFEWSSVPSGNNLHRVIIFRNGAAKANTVVPISLFDSENPEDLWKWMAAYESKTGGEMLAIPHNGNLSNGRMFETTRFNGQPMTKAYALTRTRWEPLYEVTQIKGDGEAHPYLSPNDPFADFENWDKGNLDGSVAKKKPMLQYEYARSALKLGLALEKKLGVNPFKFGMIGSTDSHTSLATTREENYYGKFTVTEPKADRYKHTVIKSLADHPKLSTFSREEVGSGLAAVWARENTREAIFDAMKRREVYATTGSRIRVRVFAGWGFKTADVTRADFVPLGYTKGVPMGGTLTAAPKGKAPVFMVRALKDPDGANLDRIQIIKGWLDANGGLQEKIYNVALSDGRKVGPDGKVKPVGNTVDVKAATYTNTIGAALLFTHWKDPDFDPKANAFYYVRVLEIPTPRWTAYDAVRFGVTMPKTVKMVVQDRAYTSPVWYKPGS